MLEQSLLREHTEYSQAMPLPASKTAEETLFHRFNQHFRTVLADTPDLIRWAQEIRYQVYCIENQFENPDDHPGEREKDKFDAHSVHSLLIHQSTGQPIGTVRLVLPRRDALEDSFAIQQVTEPSALKAPLIPIQTTAEVSRFSIPKQFRPCRAETPHGAEDLSLLIPNNSVELRAGPLMSLGLIQTLVSMSAQHGITHWCALMEPKLLRMLAAMAIHFEPIGAPVEYHGLRHPCYCHVGTVLDRVKRERPTFWQILTGAGTFGGYTLAA